jgi:hypothetical protein
MFGEVNLKHKLEHLHTKMRKSEDNLVVEAKKILKQDLFTEKKILQNLKQYKTSYQLVDEEDLHFKEIYSLDEIKKIAILYRLKFLSSHFFKPEIPDVVFLKIESLNSRFQKEIKELLILAPHKNYTQANTNEKAAVFVKTNYDNYYLVHEWGKAFKESRTFTYLPLRNFESLVVTVFIITLIIAVSLPTRLITLDHKADYWSGYRAAAFFHLLIFNFGVTVYFTFTFAKNFSSSVWNSYKDF